MADPTSVLRGVFPVLATPFLADGSAADSAGLVEITRYAIDSGADGVVYPGIASEYETLALDERVRLTDLVAKEVLGHCALIVGASAPEQQTTMGIASRARGQGAAGLMVMAPRGATDPAGAAEFFRRVGLAAGGVPLILQNAPPAGGTGMPMRVVMEIVKAVPNIAYVQEEAIPSGARIAQMLAATPPTLRGVFGGAGGRYTTDELARGVVGTMPGSDLIEIHVALMAAHRLGDRAAVRKFFNRILPLLNFQAVFRTAATKEILRRRGIIAHAGKRSAGPELDAGDRQELTELLAEVSDLLKPPVQEGL